MPVQSKRNHPILISILILSTNLRTGFTSGLFFQGVSYQNLTSISDIIPVCLTHHTFQHLSIHQLNSVLYIKSMKLLITHFAPSCPCSFPAGPNIPPPIHPPTKHPQSVVTPYHEHKHKASCCSRQSINARCMCFYLYVFRQQGCQLKF